MDLTLLAQADAVTLKLELAKSALEAAKADLELAKMSYEAFLVEADEQGVPRAKLKKLAEDRVQALIESGILSSLGYGEAKAASETKRERPRKNSRKAEEEISLEADERIESVISSGQTDGQPMMSA